MAKARSPAETFQRLVSKARRGARAVYVEDLTALGDAVAVGDDTAAAARGFLHALLARSRATVETAMACCALRGVGDETSLELVGRIPALPSPWADTTAAVTRAIRARLRRVRR